MYTKKKYAIHTHSTRDSNFDKIISMSLKGTFTPLRTQKSVVSSKTQNDYIFKQQILGQFGEIGFKKIKQTKKHVTPLRGLYFELLNKETKQIIENEVTDRASVQIRFCFQYSFSCSSCSLPAPLSSFL